VRPADDRRSGGRRNHPRLVDLPTLERPYRTALKPKCGEHFGRDSGELIVSHFHTFGRSGPTQKSP
jgi:hypothetical protein